MNFQGDLIQALCLKHSLRHLRVDAILSSQLKHETPTAQKYRWFASRGERIPPKLVVKLLQDALEAVEYEGGWVLDGFPTSKAIGVAMQQAGLIPDKIIVLESDASQTIAARSHIRVDPHDNMKEYSLKSSEVRRQPPNRNPNHANPNPNPNPNRENAQAIPSEIAWRLIHMRRDKEANIRARKALISTLNRPDPNPNLDP